jgi:hypothetical protein
MTPLFIKTLATFKICMMWLCVRTNKVKYNWLPCLIYTSSILSVVNLILLKDEDDEDDSLLLSTLWIVCCFALKVSAHCFVSMIAILNKIAQLHYSSHMLVCSGFASTACNSYGQLMVVAGEEVNLVINKGGKDFMFFLWLQTWWWWWIACAMFMWTLNHGPHSMYGLMFHY